MKKLITRTLIVSALLCANLSQAKVATSTKPASKPFVFVENKGQITGPADFKLESSAATVFVNSSGLHYQWTQLLQSGQNETYRMDILLEGTNPHGKPIADQANIYFENTFTKGRQIKAGSFERITYKDIYPGIDWVLYIKDGELEYDFVVHTGAKSTDIRLKYEGATSLELQHGSIVASSPAGRVIAKAPYSYVANNKRAISSSYILKDNILSFKVAPCAETYVIDPVLSWGTYFGGTAAENLYDVKTDAAGYIYMAGSSQSNNMATTGTFRTTRLGTTDAVLVKFAPDGQRLWSTYYGGYGANDYFGAIAIDAAGYVYAGGSTNSTTDIHTTGAYDTSYTGAGNNFMLVKFDDAGNRVWGTYYGAGNMTFGDITVDKNANIFICGATYANNNSVTGGTNVHQATFNAGAPTATNGLLANFDSSGTMKWATFYCDSNTVLTSLTCDNDNNVYAAGNTYTSKGIHTTGAHDTTYARNGADGFIVKFNPDGIRQWGTYYGGSKNDNLNDIVFDATGDLYFTGLTASAEGIAASAKHKDTIDGTGDAYIARMTPAGKLVWGSYFGGKFTDAGYRIASDNAGKIFCTGNTISYNGIATPNAFVDTIPNYAGSTYLASFDTSGRQIYGTFFRGEPGKTAPIASNATGDIYLAGTTSSFYTIATPGSHQELLAGGTDMFLAKFVRDRIDIGRSIPMSYCPLDTVRIPITVHQDFDPGNIYTVELSDSAGKFLNPMIIGTATGTDDTVITCIIPAKLKGSKTYRIRIKASAPVYVSTDVMEVEIRVGPQKPVIISNSPVCEGWNLSVYLTDTRPGITYQWTGPDNLSSTYSSVLFTNSKVSNGGTYMVTVMLNGCIAKDTGEAVVLARNMILNAKNNGPLCAGSEMSLSAADTAVPGVSYEWAGPNGFIDTSRIAVRNNAQTNLAGVYTVSTNINGCGSDTTTLVVTDPPTIKASANTPVDSGDVLTLTASSNVEFAEYNWTGPDSFVSLDQTAVIKDIRVKHAGVYKVTMTDGGCTASDSVIVSVNSLAVASFTLLPNPSAGNVILRGMALREQTIPVMVTNAMGQTVYSGDMATSLLRFDKTLDLSALPAGRYLVKIRMDNETKSLPLVLTQ